MGMAVASYAGQNYGARRFDRIRAGIRSALGIQLAYCAVRVAQMLRRDARA